MKTQELKCKFHVADPIELGLRFDDVVEDVSVRIKGLVMLK